MSLRRVARFALSRLRRQLPAQPDPGETGPVYRTVTDNDAVGCRLCRALRELLTFVWASDPARFERLMDDGGCYPALPGPAFIRIETGESFSLFRMRPTPVDDPHISTAPALWFRNEDMVVDGSNLLPAHVG